jgi:DNA-binding NarL/FixJ family response regulator
MKSVVLIDDHDIVRFGLETLVRACPQLALAGSAGTLHDGLALIAQHQPDLVITDMGLADSTGLDTVRAVIAAQSPRPTLVISMQDEMLYGEQVLALGARGFLMKEAAHSVIVPAALEVLAGGTWVSPRLGARLLNRMLRRHRGGTDSSRGAGETLSVRELDVLEQLKLGRSTKEIATTLGLSARTVDIHRANIKRKLGLRTGAELIAYASQRL